MHVNWHANLPVSDRYGFTVQLFGLLWSVSKNPHNSEAYGIFESTFAYLFILILFAHPGMQNGDKVLSSILLVGQGLKVNMLVTLELHGIF